MVEKYFYVIPISDEKTLCRRALVVYAFGFLNSDGKVFLCCLSLNELERKFVLLWARWVVDVCNQCFNG